MERGRDMARIPDAFQTAHHHGRRAPLVPVERHIGACLVERHQLHCGRSALIFAVLYGVGFWAWKQDPNMLEILRASAQFRARYDPAKWAEAPWTLLIRR